MKCWLLDAQSSSAVHYYPSLYSASTLMVTIILFFCISWIGCSPSSLFFVLQYVRWCWRNAGEVAKHQLDQCLDQNRWWVFTKHVPSVTHRGFCNYLTYKLFPCFAFTIIIHTHILFVMPPKNCNYIFRVKGAQSMQLLRTRSHHKVN
mgnify:CR=1 FL=1